MKDKPMAQVGVFGGSGFYSFLEDAEKIEVDTPYGKPSDQVVIGTIEGVKVAFIPRHGSKHNLPPHKINYQANIYAMKKLGVTNIFGPCAVGSLQPHIKPGQFVICDQFVDRTKGRVDTFYGGPKTIHVSAAQPYCPRLRKIVADIAKSMGLQFHQKGTVVVVQGPRFSTKAESKWFASQGWEVINMTQYPEAYLARELEICYVNISLVTDYDAGLEDYPDIEPVSSEDIIAMFERNNDKLRKLLFKSIPQVVGERSCICSTALKDAVVN